MLVWCYDRKPSDDGHCTSEQGLQEALAFRDAAVGALSFRYA